MENKKKIIVILSFLFLYPVYGQWNNIGNAGFSADQAFNNSLFVYNGTPFVAYRDGGKGNKATVMKYDGAKWVNVGITGFSQGQVYHISLSVFKGTPYVAYEDAVFDG